MFVVCFPQPPTALARAFDRHELPFLGASLETEFRQAGCFEGGYSAPFLAWLEKKPKRNQPFRGDLLGFSVAWGDQTEQLCLGLSAKWRTRVTRDAFGLQAYKDRMVKIYMQHNPSKVLLETHDMCWVKNSIYIYIYIYIHMYISCEVHLISYRHLNSDGASVEDAC